MYSVITGPTCKRRARGPANNHKRFMFPHISNQPVSVDWIGEVHTAYNIKIIAGSKPATNCDACNPAHTTKDFHQVDVPMAVRHEGIEVFKTDRLCVGQLASEDGMIFIHFRAEQITQLDVKITFPKQLINRMLRITNTMIAIKETIICSI